MGGILQVIFSAIGSLLYPLFSVIFTMIEVVQNIFYSFAGLRPMTVNGSNWGMGGEHIDNSGETGDNQNGIVYYLLRTETAKNILISMVILGLFLLIIFTVLAFIRNMYQTKQKKWQDIISSSIKGLINFLFLPVCCLLGVIAGNFLLGALNEATASSSDITISRQLFVTSAYGANRFRAQWDKDPADVLALDNLYNSTFGRAPAQTLRYTTDPGETIEYTDAEIEYFAQLLDEIYRSKNGPGIYQWVSVNEWYNLWNINYLIVVAGGLFMLFALIKISFGALKRLFMLVLLFVISPLACSFYPLDDGAAVGKWRSEFVKHFLSVYGAVVGMNLFFDLVPLINSISLNANDLGGTGDFLGIIPLLITIAGLYMVTDFISIVQGFIPGGSSNMLNEGQSLSNQIGGGFKKGAKVAVGTTVATAGAFVLASNYAKKRHETIKDFKTSHNADYIERRDASVRNAEEEFENENESKKGTKDYLQKGSKEYNAKLNKVQRKARRQVDKDFQSEAEEEAGGSTVGGFFRSLGKSALDQTKRIGINLVDRSGIGKPSDYKDTITNAAKTGGDRYKTEKSARQIIKDLESTKDLEGAVKTIGGKNGEILYDKLKDNKEFVAASKQAGITDFSSREAYLGQARERVRMEKDSKAAKEAEQKYYDSFDPDKIAEKLEKAFDEVLKRQKAEGKPVSNWDRTKALEHLKRGEKLTYGEGAKSEDIQLANIMNAELDHMSSNQRQSRGELQVLTTRALESVKTVSESTTDPQAKETLNEYMGHLQDVLNSLDNGQEIHAMSDTLAEKLQKLLDQQTNLSKVIKNTGTSIGKDIVKAVNDASKKPKS